MLEESSDFFSSFLESFFVVFFVFQVVFFVSFLSHKDSKVVKSSVSFFSSCSTICGSSGFSLVFSFEISSQKLPFNQSGILSSSTFGSSSKSIFVNSFSSSSVSSFGSFGFDIVSCLLTFFSLFLNLFDFSFLALFPSVLGSSFSKPKLHKISSCSV